jgi:hypothetical protein
MQPKHYSIAALTATFLVIFNAQSSYAVSITYDTPPAANINFNKVPYIIGNREGQAWVKEDVRVLQRGGTPGLRRLLEENFPDWRFITAPPKESNQSLRGEFRVRHYYACGYNMSDCGYPSVFPVNNVVGALFDVDFIPGEGDPQFPNRLNWIQRVVSNHSEEPRWYGTHNLKEDRIDIQDRTDSPYYFPTINNPNFFFSHFFDRPTRGDAENSHYWNAELFLVEEIGRNTVRIYDGISWGWRNQTKRRRQDYCLVNSISSDNNCSYYFSDSLSSGTEVDSFKLPGLTPGKRFTARIDNDIPGNRCNPNTYLTASDNSGYINNFDDNSSPLGNGFASALMGTVSSDGTINLDVRAANGGRRGEDRGNYELYIDLYEEGESPPDDFFVAASSGGGGFGNETETPGRTQQDPILPNARDGNWQVFRNVPGCRWYDPHTTYGFEFQALDDTLFTEILDFPIGDDNRFTVSVGDTILGEFSPGESLDFVSLFGHGISNFKITDIDSLFGSTEETAFPIQLAFNDRIGSFKMRPISKESSPQSVPEFTPVFGLLTLGTWGFIKALKIRSNKQQ